MIKNKKGEIVESKRLKTWRLALGSFGFNKFYNAKQVSKNVAFVLNVFRLGILSVWDLVVLFILSRNQTW